MKEKLFEILHNRKRMPGERFSDIEGKIENLVNQEVEKQIAERMPSEDEMDNEVDNRYPNVANPHIFGKQLGFGDCYFWLHSRLTCSEKPNNSQKTEGGEE